MSLFRIVYVSDAVGGAGDSLLALIDIIGVSDRNNRRDHLTGVLMRRGGRFFQAIEGARIDLDRLMGRIRADRRHANIRILADAPIEQRLFAGQPMAQLEAPPALDRLLALSPHDPAIGRSTDALLADARRAVAALA